MVRVFIHVDFLRATDLLSANPDEQSDARQSLAHLLSDMLSGLDDLQRFRRKALAGPDVKDVTWQIQASVNTRSGGEPAPSIMRWMAGNSISARQATVRTRLDSLLDSAQPPNYQTPNFAMKALLAELNGAQDRAGGSSKTSPWAAAPTHVLFVALSDGSGDYAPYPGFARNGSKRMKKMASEYGVKFIGLHPTRNGAAVRPFWMSADWKRPEGAWMRILPRRSAAMEIMGLVASLTIGDRWQPCSRIPAGAIAADVLVRGELQGGPDDNLQRLHADGETASVDADAWAARTRSLAFLRSLSLRPEDQGLTSPSTLHKLECDWEYLQPATVRAATPEGGPLPGDMVRVSLAHPSDSPRPVLRGGRLEVQVGREPLSHACTLDSVFDGECEVGPVPEGSDELVVTIAGSPGWNVRPVRETVHTRQPRAASVTSAALVGCGDGAEVLEEYYFLFGPPSEICVSYAIAAEADESLPTPALRGLDLELRVGGEAIGWTPIADEQGVAQFEVSPDRLVGAGAISVHLAPAEEASRWRETKRRYDLTIDKAAAMTLPEVADWRIPTYVLLALFALALVARFIMNRAQRTALELVFYVPSWSEHPFQTVQVPTKFGQWVPPKQLQPALGIDQLRVRQWIRKFEIDVAPSQSFKRDQRMRERYPHTRQECARATKDRFVWGPFEVHCVPSASGGGERK
ncbi:MAG: hypothetical protein ACQEXJ_21100 [Myxococcota bacterium]